MRKPYPFSADEMLMKRGKELAEAYKLSFNQMLVFMLDHHVENWTVPKMEPRPKPSSQDVKKAA